MVARLLDSVGVPFRSLRARLLAAFVAVILLTLLLAGSATVWLVQGYRTRLAVDHLTDLALAATAMSRQLERQEARPEEIAALVANQLGATGARALVIDAQGRVLAERPSPPPGQEPWFAGRRIEVPAAGTAEARSSRALRPILGVRSHVWTVRADGSGRQIILIAAGPLPPPEARPDVPERFDRFLVRQPAYQVVLGVPAHNLGSVWRELASSLAWAALLAISASVAVAWWLSHSVTWRLHEITRAAEAIARGELRQSIPERGGDEVAQLARSFNIMSREVEQSHQALRDFLANASHELRTPLTSIRGFSQALLDNALTGPEGAAEAGRIINEEADRMRRLVEDLLYLSRVEARDIATRREWVDVSVLLREEARRLGPVCQQRGLELRLDLPDLLQVQGDADELDHLFGNLLDNAAKYTPEGGRIDIAATAGADAIRIRVHNTGSYIPVEDQPRIFERFYRLDKSRAREVEGSGLGLAIAWQVAERHGGRILVNSDPDQGTTFEVVLPGTRAPATQPISGTRRSASAASAAPAYHAP